MKMTSLFLPEEHIILADWLGVEPIDKPDATVTIEDALKTLD
jgi:hypothetical protein